MFGAEKANVDDIEFQRDEIIEENELDIEAEETFVMETGEVIDIDDI